MIPDFQCICDWPWKSLRYLCHCHECGREIEFDVPRDLWFELDWFSQPADVLWGDGSDMTCMPCMIKDMNEDFVWSGE